MDIAELLLKAGQLAESAEYKTAMKKVADKKAAVAKAQEELEAAEQQYEAVIPADLRNLKIGGKAAKKSGGPATKGKSVTEAQVKRVAVKGEQNADTIAKALGTTRSEVAKAVDTSKDFTVKRNKSQISITLK